MMFVAGKLCTKDRTVFHFKVAFLLRRFWTCVSFNFGGLLVFCPYGRSFVTLTRTKESQAHIRLRFDTKLLPLVLLTDFSHL